MDRRWLCIAAAILLLPRPLGAECDSLGSDYVPSEGCLLLLGTFEPGWVPGLGPDFAVDVAVMTAAFGPPDSIRYFEPYEEHFTGLMLHSRALHWRGLSVTVDSLEGDLTQTPWLGGLVLRSPDVSLPCGLSVGMPFAAFMSSLGGPARSKDGRHEYYWMRLECREGVWHVWHAFITLVTGSDGVVREIQWEPFSD